MNYELIISDLEKWQNDECLFRDYCQVKDDKEKLERFLEIYSGDPITLGYALHPEEIATCRQEEEFISDGRNVSIIKHPRYFPLFFHEHKFFEIIYVLSGSCTQHFQEKSIQLEQGDLFLLAPGIQHGIEVFDDRSIIINILIRYTTFLDIFMNTIRDKTQISQFFLNNIYNRKRLRYMIFHTYHDTDIRNYILDMYLEQLHQDEYSDRIICSLLTIFFTQLMRSHKRSIEMPETSKSRSCLENDMMNYIVNHYETLSIKQLAEHFHFSRQYCSRLIKDVTGYTFSELLTNIRLQQGENYLLVTNLSVEDISEKVGYKNPETFIRVFKKYQETTPAQYRKENRYT